jgi:hypothetical protein
MDNGHRPHLFLRRRHHHPANMHTDTRNHAHARAHTAPAGSRSTRAGPGSGTASSWPGGSLARPPRPPHSARPLLALLPLASTSCCTTRATGQPADRGLWRGAWAQQQGALVSSQHQGHLVLHYAGDGGGRGSAGLGFRQPIYRGAVAGGQGTSSRVGQVQPVSPSACQQPTTTSRPPSGRGLELRGRSMPTAELAPWDAVACRSTAALGPPLNSHHATPWPAAPRPL